MCAKALATEKPATDTPKVKLAMDFIEGSKPSPLPSIVACFGSDDFLRRTALKKCVAMSSVDEETIRSYDGDESQWRDVHDELATRSLFDDGGLRMAIVRGADKFVSKHRESLEKWIDNPAENTSLLLEIQTLAANTRIYKLIGSRGWLISCAAGNDKGTQTAIGKWARIHHGLELTPQQCALIVERIGPIWGLIDGELAKLALFADTSKLVSDDRVAELVGGWRTQTAWELADAIAEGRTAQAIEQLDKLVNAGQTIVGLAAQLSWSLRRYGLAAQLIEQSERMGARLPIQTAVERAGFNRFELAKAEQRLRRIGRVRARRMLHDFVALELSLKGSHSHEHRARAALESLILSLA